MNRRNEVVYQNTKHKEVISVESDYKQLNAQGGRILPC